MNAIDFEPWMEVAVAEVLEAMCFTSTEGEAGDEYPDSHPDWICGRLEFKGSPSGRFGVAVSQRAASAIAANFLGEDELSVTEPQTVEVICELTNMVCGTLLAHVEPRKTFSLSPPQNHPIDAQETLSPDRISRTFSLDDGLLHTWLEIRDSL